MAVRGNDGKIIKLVRKNLIIMKFISSFYNISSRKKKIKMNFKLSNSAVAYTFK